MASKLNKSRVVTINQVKSDVLTRCWEEKDLPNTIELYRRFAECHGLPAHNLSIEKLRRDGFCEHPWYYGFLTETIHDDKLVTVGIAIAMRVFPLERVLSIQCLWTVEGWRQLGIEGDLVCAVSELGNNLGCRLTHWIGGDKFKSIENLADYVNQNWIYYRMDLEDMINISK